MESQELNRISEPVSRFLKNTDEYRRYFHEKEKLSRFPELKKQIDEFRRRNFELQNQENADVLFDKIDEFEREFESLRDNPLVNDFLAAELAVCRLIQEFFIHITEELDFDMDLGQGSDRLNS